MGNPASPPTSPVHDSVAKVGNEVAVGEDLEFQRRWWRFEKAAWMFFGFIVLLDLAGVFGRGPVANAHKQSADGALTVHYERVQRFSTPSILTLQFGPGAIHNGAIQLWAGESIVDTLGNQRIIPQPSTSSTIDGGIAYTFPSGPHPNSVEFALQPARPGFYHFTIRLIPGGNPSQPMDSITAGVFVMP